MWYTLTIDFRIFGCMILQRLYGYFASLLLCLFKLYHPFVISKIKERKIEELKKSIELLQKNNETNERVLGIQRSGIERMQTMSEYENVELQESHSQLIASISLNIADSEKRRLDTEGLILEVQDAITRLQKVKKVVIHPELNFWHCYFMIAQLRKRKFRKLVKLYSDFNRKFF